ncbi:MAG: MATE family efflux transporter [Verrucomicrobiota bacterium]|nr:MATE family efflux transporter [Verrucomicrobiota bacterium]
MWTISLPLMVSTLASLLMIFTDRIFLARYSLSALNASVNAGTLAWAIMITLGMITAMSEVFVAQYNGAKRYDRLGVPVWQMIWFALFSFLIYIPIGIWGAPLIFEGSRYAEFETVYFRWLMFFGPSYALMTAFAGFFIGRGKTAVMIWLAVIANLLNIVLDWVLIFGVPGFIPELGIQGAAIATCTGYFFESAVLAYLFLSKENREKFGTNQWKIDWAEMKKCFRVGLPQGIFCGLEIFGWSVFFWMMTSLGEMHITVSSICQSFTILLSFFCDGLSRGAAAVAGNLIGGQKSYLLNKVLRSGVVLLILFSLFTSVFLVIDPQDTVRLLFFEHLPSTPAPSFTLDPSLQSAVKTCTICAFVYMFFEGFRWLLSGLLVAAGDTLFLLIAGALSVWLFLLLPIYLFVVRLHLPVEYAWILTVIYSGLLLVVYWIRFKQGRWQKIDLLEEDFEDEQQALD